MQADEKRNTVIAELNKHMLHVESTADEELVDLCAAGGEPGIMSDGNLVEQMGEACSLPVARCVPGADR